jgi:putative lipoprotein
MRRVIVLNLLILSILLLSACESGGPSITGEVTYRQRIALPEEAVVTVQLQDVSLMDVETKVLGEQVIETGGDQVPFAYEVEYDEDEIIDNHTYSMSARITDGGGNLLFISDTANLVITNGNPTSDVEIVTVPVGGG